MVYTLVNLVGFLMIHFQTQNVRCKVIMMLSCFTSRFLRKTHKKLPLSSIDYLTWACFRLKYVKFKMSFPTEIHITISTLKSRLKGSLIYKNINLSVPKSFD